MPRHEHSPVRGAGRGRGEEVGVGRPSLVNHIDSGPRTVRRNQFVPKRLGVKVAVQQPVHGCGRYRRIVTTWLTGSVGYNTQRRKGDREPAHNNGVNEPEPG